MTRQANAEATRARVLDAAFRCILNVGYYQASSNAIAREAGVTWGTIQHQFGTREALLVEVLDERLGRLDDHLARATVVGATLEERLRSVLELLEVHYGRPEHLVFVQILLDLSADPGTSSSARRAVQKHGRSLARIWEPFFVQAMGEAGQHAELAEYVFLTLRGYLTANLLVSRLQSVGHNPEIRDLLVRGVAGAVRERARELGLSVDPDRSTTSRTSKVPRSVSTVA
jgi:AcrR family transcriptional regulator